MTVKKGPAGAKAGRARESGPQPSKVKLKAFLDRAVVLAEPALAALGLELVYAQCPLEGGRPVLRLFIDRLGAEGAESPASGIGLDDCAAASRAVDAVLEADDQGDQPDGYVLEVSSPGLNRPLLKESDYRRFQGRLVKIKLRIDGRAAVFKGRLARTEDGGLALETPEGFQPFAFEQVLSARLSLDEVMARARDLPEEEI